MVSGAASSDPLVDLLSIGRHLWRLKWVIIAGSLLFPACAWALSWVLPREYEAVSVVRIVSLEYVRVEPYEQFAKTDAITQRLIGNLRARKLIEDEASLGSRSVLLGVSREVPSGYLPALSLSVKAKSPQLAQDAANTWAAVIVEEQAKAEPLQATPAALADARPEAASALETAEQQLLLVRQKNSKALMAARQLHDVTAKRAELEERQTRTIALEEELMEVRQLKLTNPRAQPSGPQSRETVLAALLERSRSEASRVARELDAADAALLNLEREHNLHEKQLERAVSEAADKYQRIAEHTNVPRARWVRLELGSRAPMPPGPGERSRRVALIAIPFGIFVSFGLAFVAALVNERRSARS